MQNLDIQYKILNVLNHGGRYMCYDMEKATGARQSNIHRALQNLIRAGHVKMENNIIGKKKFYSLAKPMELVVESIKTDINTKAQERITAILDMIYSKV